MVRTARTEAEQFAGRDHAVALFAGAVALAVYCLTLARTVTGEDSGELITAAWSLGIPHPPGYSLWCLLAHVFTWLPMGVVAWRVALFSAACAAAAVYCTVLLVRAVGCGRWAACAAGLALAFSREFWEQAVIAEVYSLNALCVTLCLLLLFTWYRSRHGGWLCVLAAVYGLSLGNHGTMVLLGPLFALFVLTVDRPRSWGRYAGLTALALLACFLVYLYLPLRSLADPAIDWGNPETPANWWNVVRRKQYAFMLTAQPRSWARLAEQMATCAGLWWREFTPWVGLLGLAGILLLVIRRPWHGLLVVGAGLVSVLGFAYLQNFDQSIEWVWVMSVFYIPAYLATAVGVGVALDWARRLPGMGFPLLLTLSLVAAGSPLLTHWDHNNRAQSFTAEDYARNLIAPLAPDAIVVTETDTGAFAGLYLQAVEGLRPDVLLGRVNGYLSPTLLDDAPTSLRKAVGPFPRRRDEPRIFTWLLEHTKRPVYFERRPQLEDCEVEVRWVRAGYFLWRALRPGESDATDYLATYTWRSLTEDVARGDYTARAVLLALRLGEADDALREGDDARAGRLVNEGLAAYGRDVRSLNNAGTLYARHGRTTQATRFFQEALAVAPGEATVLKNLERLGGTTAD